MFRFDGNTNTGFIPVDEIREVDMKSKSKDPDVLEAQEIMNNNKGYCPFQSGCMDTLDPTQSFIRVPGRNDWLMVVPNILVTSANQPEKYYLILSNYRSFYPFLCELTAAGLSLLLTVSSIKLFRGVKARVDKVKNEPKRHNNGFW